MRPKFVAAVLSLSLILGAGIWWLKNGLSAIRVNANTVAQIVSSAPPPRAIPRFKVSEKGNHSVPERDRAMTDAEIERLSQLSLTRDQAALPEIFAALKHPDREVREAAMEAITQMGDSNAIPVLKEASEMVDDPEEKSEFLEAMEFLSVQPLTFDASDPVKSPARSEISERRRVQRRMERDQGSRGTEQARSSTGNLSPEVIAR